MKIQQAGMPAQPKICFNWHSCPLIPLKVTELGVQLRVKYSKLLSLFGEGTWGGSEPQPGSQGLRAPCPASTNTWQMFRKHFFSHVYCWVIFVIELCYLKSFIISNFRTSHGPYICLQDSLSSHHPTGVGVEGERVSFLIRKEKMQTEPQQ